VETGVPLVPREGGEAVLYREIVKLYYPVLTEVEHTSVKFTPSKWELRVTLKVVQEEQAAVAVAGTNSLWKVNGEESGSTEYLGGEEGGSGSFLTQTNNNNLDNDNKKKPSSLISEVTLPPSAPAPAAAAAKPDKNPWVKARVEASTDYVPTKVSERPTPEPPALPSTTTTATTTTTTSSTTASLDKERSTVACSPVVEAVSSTPVVNSSRLIENDTHRNSKNFDLEGCQVPPFRCRQTQSVVSIIFDVMGIVESSVNIVWGGQGLNADNNEQRGGGHGEFTLTFLSSYPAASEAVSVAEGGGKNPSSTAATPKHLKKWGLRVTLWGSVDSKSPSTKFSVLSLNLALVMAKMKPGEKWEVLPTAATTTTTSSTSLTTQSSFTPSNSLNTTSTTVVAANPSSSSSSPAAPFVAAAGPPQGKAEDATSPTQKSQTLAMPPRAKPPTSLFFGMD